MEEETRCDLDRKETHYSSDKPSEEALKVLRSTFGHKDFRPMQWQIINSLLKDKRDNCAILTAGHGKSLCYQFPAAFSKGITFVISPLIPLIEDLLLDMPVTKIPTCILGARTYTEEKLQDVIENKFSLVYFSPELCTPSREGFLKQIASKVNLTLIAIDEAHCASTLSKDYHHTYYDLGMLKDIFPGVPTLAVTGTVVTEKARQDIINMLKLRNPQISMSEVDRPNIYLEVRRKTKNIFDNLKSLMVKHNDEWMFQGSTIIYCQTSRETEKLSEVLKTHDIENMPYHTGLSSELRQAALDSFMKNEISVIIVATNAFSIGIDKPDIRTVIHYGASSSLETYYQEVGCAGRDGLTSKSVIFYNFQDFNAHYSSLYDRYTPNIEIKRPLLKHMKWYLKATHFCRRQFILNYFERSKPVISRVNKNCCDNCTKKLPSECGIKYDFTEDVTKYLSVVRTLQTKRAHGTFISFLKGSNKVTDKQVTVYDRQSVYFGCGAGKSEAWWKAVSSFIEMKGFLWRTKRFAPNGFPYYVYGLSFTGNAFLNQPEESRKLEEVPVGKLAEILEAKKRTPESEEKSTKEQKRVKKPMSKVLQNDTTELPLSENCFPSINSLMDTSRNSLEEFEMLRINLTRTKVHKVGKEMNNSSNGTEGGPPIKEDAQNDSNKTTKQGNRRRKRTPDIVNELNQNQEAAMAKSMEDTKPRPAAKTTSSKSKSAKKLLARQREKKVLQKPREPNNSQPIRKLPARRCKTIKDLEVLGEPPLAKKLKRL